MPPLSRPTPALVVAVIALFVSLGGTGYAAIKITGKNVKNGSLTGKDVKNSSLAGADVKNKSLTGKDFKAGQLPAGPRGFTGLPGATGPRGAAGAARAYAHVSHGSLVAADSTGISAMTMGCAHSCTGVPAAGNKSTDSYCFKLAFVPSSVQVTPDGGSSSSDDAYTATEWSVHVPGKTPSEAHEGCPPGYTSAEVQADTNVSYTTIVTGLYITFN